MQNNPKAENFISLGSNVLSNFDQRPSQNQMLEDETLTQRLSKIQTYRTGSMKIVAYL